jgi:hypothetical protein
MDTERTKGARKNGERELSVLAINLLAPKFFFWHTLCINVNNTRTKYIRIMKQTAF